MKKPDMSWHLNQFFLLDGLEEKARELKKRAYGAINVRGMKNTHEESGIREHHSTYNFHKDSVRTTPKYPSF